MKPPAQDDSGSDDRFMALALALGRRGLGRTWPNPAVGAVIVKDEIIVGRGWTQPGGRPHAEVEALARAGAAARGATLYVTLEPCSHHGKSPPCADAVMAAGIARVVSAMEDPNPEVAGQGHARLRAAGIAVDVGTRADEARRAHAGHLRRMREHRPEILLKLAVSADDKVGLPGRRAAAITGEAARDRTHLMRAMHDAILIGIGTALADDPLLTCRLPGMADRSPVRVVLDSNLRLPVSSRLVTSARATPLWIVASEAAPHQNEQALRLAGAEVIRVHSTHLTRGNLLAALAEHGITRLMVEGGPIISAAFLAADVVDEVALFRSQVRLGGAAINALEGLPLTALTESPRLMACDIEPVGEDSLAYYERV
jgi:diaminohydroxyphosphoribosylaminopyrimidine deaminase/5-amino-6-(5-phosphoribosylamino)uracil reductase